MRGDAKPVPLINGHNGCTCCDDNFVNESDITSSSQKLVPAIGSSDLSATLDGVGSNLFLQLQGEVQDLAGVLNTDAAYRVKAMENVKGITSEGDWGYYAKQLAGSSGQFIKVWIRWNTQKMIFDYSLDADAGEVFSHAAPYVGEIFF